MKGVISWTIGVLDNTSKTEKMPAPTRDVRPSISHAVVIFLTFSLLMRKW